MRYLVLGPAPTAAIPLAWTATDPAVRLIDAPGAGITVYLVTGQLSPMRCPVT